MKEIANNEYYELSYDEEKNWICWIMKGFWKSMDVVPDFDKDWDTAMQMTKSHWKILADLSKLKAMLDDVKDAQDKKQQELMQRGCVKVSCIVVSVITRMSTNEVIRKSGMDKMIQYFDNADKARKWLEL